MRAGTVRARTPSAAGIDLFVPAALYAARRSVTIGNALRPSTNVTSRTNLSLNYDAAGRNVRTTDPLGRISTTVYDRVGQTVATIDPLLNRTSFVFDGAGRKNPGHERPGLHHDHRLRRGGAREIDDRNRGSSTRGSRTPTTPPADRSPSRTS
jgi:YD repeat-containing protein